MGRTFLMIRSVGFALFTKLSGAATVFVALPLVARGVSAQDYTAFLTAMNVAAAIGLVFAPFGVLFIRDIAHAFASDDPKAPMEATRRCFSAHAALSLVVAALFALAGALWAALYGLKPAIVVGVALNFLQIAAGFGQIYRIAERTDHVTSLVQTAANLALVGGLLALAHFGRLNDMTVCLVYFGAPALADLCVFLQVAATRGLSPKIGKNAFAALWARAPESLPLFLSPFADYVKIYASAMIALAVAGAHDYIVFSTSVLFIARLVNPLTLVTRPLMPAFIDALQRRDALWLNGLRRALFAAAGLGAAVAATLPFVVNRDLLALALPKEVGEVSAAFVLACAYFAFSYALVSLLAPLYIGARRAVPYGVVNLAFTLAGAAAGALLALRFGAQGMMSAMAGFGTISVLVLLASMDWGAARKPGQKP
ncbi:hypothetical protein [Methylocella sp.]|uniref:hypothetical protein n=1 Tax=Methylocella sp. TaxID=1978226 RepID=UPI003783431E